MTAPDTTVEFLLFGLDWTRVAEIRLNEEPLAKFGLIELLINI